MVEEVNSYYIGKYPVIHDRVEIGRQTMDGKPLVQVLSIRELDREA